jgi:hypothetical protein
MHVCSPSSTWDSSDREGQLFLAVLELGCFSREAAIARCYGARRKTENNYQLHIGDTMAASELCRSTDMNVLLAIVTKWEDMGCTPGTTPGYSSLPRTHKTQKPSVSQGLYPILLLAVLALTTSAYTSLSVSQNLNPQRQLLKASVYHSATSAGTKLAYCISSKSNLSEEEHKPHACKRKKSQRPKWHSGHRNQKNNKDDKPKKNKCPPRSSIARSPIKLNWTSACGTRSIRAAASN